MKGTTVSSTPTTRRNDRGRRCSFSWRGFSAVVCAIAVGWVAEQYWFRDADVEPVAAQVKVQRSAATATWIADPANAWPAGAGAPARSAPNARPDRDALLQAGRDLAERWPASMDEARRQAFHLAEENPIAALILLQPLRGRNLDGITSWEREIMLGWAQRDLSGMCAGLETCFRDDRAFTEHWLSIGASIMQNERRDGLADMLHWLDRADRAGAESLTLLATSKLVTHVTAESADTMIAFLSGRASEPMYRDALVHLANSYAHQAPERVLSRIQSFPDVSLRRDALLSVVAAVTWDKPATVLEWLNSGTLLVNAGLAELSGQEATKLRDEILTSYFSSLVSAHPGYVAQYSNAVTDLAARQYLQNMAEVMARTERLSATDLWVDVEPAPRSNGQSNP
jgi:hypothetical protein